MNEPTQKAHVVASFRLSPLQEAQWLGRAAGPQGRLQCSLALEGALDAEQVRRALDLLIARHESLRTTFARRAGMVVPLQAVHDRLDPVWIVTDVGGQDALAALEADELTAPMDLEQGPLVRAHLGRLAADRHVLVVTVAAAAVDPASLPALVRELTAHLTGGVELFDEPLQPADFADWHHERRAADDDVAVRGRAHWAAIEAELAHLASSIPPGDGRARAVAVDLAPEIVAGIDALAARYGTDPATVVAAAWHAFVGRLTGADRVAVATVCAGRRLAELDGAIGPFAYALPIVSDVSDDRTVVEVLSQVRRATTEAQDNEEQAPVCVPPLTIGFTALEPVDTVTADGISIWVRGFVPDAEPVALRLVWSAVAGTPRIELRHDSPALDAAQATRLAESFTCLLADAVARPDTPVGSLALSSDADGRRLVDELNPPATVPPTVRVDELFARNAALAPDRIAVVAEDGELTYAALDARANRLAHALRDEGVGPGVVVGLCTDRSTDMVVGVLGILKAGGAYLPLHGDHPKARLAAQLAQTCAAVVVTQEGMLDRLPDSAHVVCLDRDRARLDAQPDTPPTADAGSDDPVYVIFTSGSTGTPKGVVVSHANLANYVDDLIARVDAGAQPLSFGLVTALATDLGNTAVFPALASGGTLVVASPTVAADPSALAAWFDAHPVDVLKITPSHLRALLADVGGARVLPRRWLVVGGEALSWELADHVRRAGSCRILNHYGPTETTIGSCVLEVGDGGSPTAPTTATVPIGRPIANTRCYVLDAHARPVPIGFPGELHISGAGVARGYHGAPDLTAERFGTDPLSSVPGARRYATGDRARWLPDGTLEFLGRVDDQVKIRGYRVEPAEVAAALAEHPAVRQAVVVAREDKPGDLRLVGYVVASPAPASEELRATAAARLPDHMVPSVVVAVDAFPLGASGKVDTRALPSPDELVVRRVAFAEPRTELERAVASIWQEVLGLDRVGVDDDFFELGGHSLLATQIVARLRNATGVPLPLHVVFTDPTVAALAAVIDRESARAEAPDEDLARLVADVERLSDAEVAALLAKDDVD